MLVTIGAKKVMPVPDILRVTGSSTVSFFLPGKRGKRESSRESHVARYHSRACSRVQSSPSKKAFY